MATTTQPRLRTLTPAQVDEYHANGFLIVEDFISPEERRLLIDHFMSIHAGRKQVEGISARDPASPPSVYWQRYFNTHRIDELSMRYLKLPRAGDALYDLMGYEPVGIQSMFFFKAPGTPGQAYHQDTNYIPSDPETLTACWIALDDADEETGTMWVVPGSNNGPLLKRKPVTDTDEHEDWTDELDGVDYSKEVPVIVRAGGAVFFHGRLMHQSRKNRTADRFRRVYVCHYVARGATVERKDLQEQIPFDHFHTM
ncbi:MAG: phytanoyl-CoA dioxygenase family protein [Candidatus Latescibacteria bacterium]|nr:phytanoyl-CoA dioxygenase family protein [Candidatus Latescibacterota bacterium]